MTPSKDLVSHFQSDLGSQYFSKALNGLVDGNFSSKHQKDRPSAPLIIGFYTQNGIKPATAPTFKPDNSRTMSGIRALAVDTKKQEDSNALIKDINDQTTRINELPPLALMINPSSLTKRMERNTDTARGRRGSIVSMWHEQMTVLSAEGTTSGQYIWDEKTKKQGGINGPGRVLSIGYSNLLSLIQIYRSNGIIYSSQDHKNGSRGVPISVGSVYIQYDGYTYVGSFDSFTITDEANKPHNFNYNFEFTCRYIFKT